LSERREVSKIEQVVELFESHNLIMAFDSTIITLDYFKNIISQRYPHIEIQVVTGSTQKSTILQKFELGSEAKNLLGLFSDSMSEGVNLQQASALFFLDMPSVLRVAEQRIGRIDRLDSPHNEIQIFWPDDSDEFALKTDHRLVKTLSDAEVLIGSNFQIPDELLGKHPHEITFDQVVKAEDMLQHLDRDDRDDYLWDGIQDAFGSVHDLYEGENPLIAREDYEELKGVNATVKCKVSIVDSEKQWLFIALRGSKKSSPRWYFIDSDNNIYFELTDVCQQLRHHLNNSPKKSEWTDKTSMLLEQYFDVLQRNEIKLLPNKRKRALEVAKYILKRLASQNTSHAYLYHELLRLFEPASFDSEYSIDYYDFSQQWLDLFSLYLAEKRQKYKRRIISLNDLKRGKEFKEFTETEMRPEKLQHFLTNAPYKQSHWKNIAACIIGIPSD
jgi:hypothetical protein